MIKFITVTSFVSLIILNGSFAFASGTEKKPEKQRYYGSGSERPHSEQTKKQQMKKDGSATERKKTVEADPQEPESTPQEGSGTERRKNNNYGSGTERE